MKVQRQDSSQERAILIGMVTDKTVLGRVSSKWHKDGLFHSKWANLVGQWCVSFYDRYGKAPLKSVEGLYQNWAESAKDEATVKLVEKFLSHISEEYARKGARNSDYLIDQASSYFHRVQINKLKEELEADLDAGDLDKADKRIQLHNKVEMGIGSFVDIFHDKEAVKKSFESRGEPLIKYPGALGNFFGNNLERDGFLAFWAPEKRGKSHWLLDMAYRAMIQDCRVAYFQIGDMSQDQIVRRLMTRHAKQPMESKTIKIPTYIEHEGDAPFASVDVKEKVFAKPLDFDKAWKECEKIAKMEAKPRDRRLKISAIRT